MCPQADFLDAHERHWNDAELLSHAQRWANADHLYGMAVECGLKCLMMVSGMDVDASGNPIDKKYWKHAKDIWILFESCRSGRLLGTEYALPTRNPFHDWDISDRYAHHSHFNETRTQSRQQGGQTVCELIKKARLEGLI